jgi:hypothetical protein
MTTHPGVFVWLVIAVSLSPATVPSQQPPALSSRNADSAWRDSVPAILTGRVIDSAGVGLPGAEITLSTSNRLTAITGDSGEFRITGLRPGANVFGVRRLGFSAATFTAILKPGKTHRATFELSGAAHPLPTVAISDTSVTSHWLDVFDQRRSTLPGTFITRADFVKHEPRNGIDIVRTVPGIRITTGRNGQSQVIMTRGAAARTCMPTMFLQNLPYSGTLEDFSADDIEALEIYLGVSEIPAELDKNGKGICGAIVVWTRDPRKSP